MRPLFARALGPHPTLAIVAPGFAIAPERLEAGAARLRAAGFETVWRDDLLAVDGYFAGDDARRADELMQWVRDPQVDALFCARGGYGVARVLPKLDAEIFARARKPLVGFSDATGLLLWQRATSGLVGFHGPMFNRADGPTEPECERLARALRGEPLAPLQGRGLHSGRASGALVGGSLTLLANSLGTRFELDTRDALLLIEEVGEKPYAIDRQLQHLHAAGKLEAAAGFAVGALVACDDPRHPAPDAEAVVAHALGAFGKPLVTGLPFGHGSLNLSWPFGVTGRLDGEAGTLEVLEPGARAG